MKTHIFDAAEFLDTADAQAEFIAAAMDTGDAGHIANAVGIVARAHGMGQIATESGLTRESLYRALSADGNPTLITLTKVLSVLWFRLTVVREHRSR